MSANAYYSPIEVELKERIDKLERVMGELIGHLYSLSRGGDDVTFDPDLINELYEMKADIEGK